MHPKKLPRRQLLSFKHAFAGMLAALKEEPNLKFHFVIGLLVLAAGIFLQISKSDWLIILFLIGFVISLELTNTAIEAVVDAFTDKQHPMAKHAKDISAGAVLIAALTSAIIGMIVFFPYINNFLSF